MKREDFTDLTAFLAVAENRSFTRAAAELGTSQSSLSHVVRRLEERLDVRLLSRTTRNVSLTEAGYRLADALRPAFDRIEDRLSELDALRERPAGTIRLTAGQFPTRTLIAPAVDCLVAQYPDLDVEISVESRFVDIVKERFDAGVRLGERLEKGMSAVRIGPDIRMAVVGAPAYFEAHPIPETPYDLTGHLCVNLRMLGSGDTYLWEFEKDGRELNVRVEGQFTSNDSDLVIQTALNGRGLACLPDDHLMPMIEDGRLIRVLEDWCPPFPGYHLYYSNRRQNSRSFQLLVESLRYTP